MKMQNKDSNTFSTMRDLTAGTVSKSYARKSTSKTRS